MVDSLVSNLTTQLNLGEAAPAPGMDMEDVQTAPEVPMELNPVDP